MHRSTRRPEALNRGRRASQRRGLRVIEDPTETFLRRYAKDYEAFESHAFVGSRSASKAARAATDEHTAGFARGDTSSDEAFYPLNFGLRRR